MGNNAIEQAAMALAGGSRADQRIDAAARLAELPVELQPFFGFFDLQKDKTPAMGSAARRMVIRLQDELTGELAELRVSSFDDLIAGISAGVIAPGQSERLAAVAQKITGILETGRISAGWGHLVHQKEYRIGWASRPMGLDVLSDGNPVVETDRDRFTVIDRNHGTVVSEIEQEGSSERIVGTTTDNSVVFSRSNKTYLDPVVATWSPSTGEVHQTTVWIPTTGHLWDPETDTLTVYIPRVDYKDASLATINLMDGSSEKTDLYWYAKNHSSVFCGITPEGLLVFQRYDFGIEVVDPMRRNVAYSMKNKEITRALVSADGTIVCHKNSDSDLLLWNPGREKKPVRMEMRDITHKVIRHPSDPIVAVICWGAPRYDGVHDHLGTFSLVDTQTREVIFEDHAINRCNSIAFDPTGDARLWALGRKGDGEEELQLFEADTGR